MLILQVCIAIITLDTAVFVWWGGGGRNGCVRDDSIHMHH